MKTTWINAYICSHGGFHSHNLHKDTLLRMNTTNNLYEIRGRTNEEPSISLHMASLFIWHLSTILIECKSCGGSLNTFQFVNLQGSHWVPCWNTVFQYGKNKCLVQAKYGTGRSATCNQPDETKHTVGPGYNGINVRVPGEVRTDNHTKVLE